jgi:LAO/AO transport system kinase
MVLAPGLGDDIQAMKAGLLEVADILVVNKADKPGAEGLLLDMQHVADCRPENTTRQTMVCKTIAKEQKGVAELLDIIFSMAKEDDDSGEKSICRQRGRRLEVLDWAVELSKPQFEEAILDMDLQGDPLEIAKRVVQETKLN